MRVITPFIHTENTTMQTTTITQVGGLHITHRAEEIAEHCAAMRRAALDFIPSRSPKRVRAFMKSLLAAHRIYEAHEARFDAHYDESDIADIMGAVGRILHINGPKGHAPYETAAVKEIYNSFVLPLHFIVASGNEDSEDMQEL